MSSPRKTLRESLTGFPAAGITYGMAAALFLGVACGLLHAPFAIIAILGLVVAAASLRMEWRALTVAADGARRSNIGLQLAAAYVFLALVAIGLVAVGDFTITALRR
jgi:hypothetical protein